MRSVGIVLAGGAGRRLGGRDKASILLGGRPMLDHVLARLRPQVAAVGIAAGGDPERFAAWGLPTISDRISDQVGPLAGILAGMEWAAAAHPEVDWLVSVPTDVPFLPFDLVDRLAAARGTARVAAAASGGRTHFATALWPVDLAADLRRALAEGLRRVEEFAARYPLAVAEFAVTPFDPFFNVNRPDDLAVAEGLLPEVPMKQA